MKKNILILSTCFSLLAGSCTDDSLPDSPTGENNGNKRTITFSISKGDDSGFDVTTRANGTLVPGNYAVKFYLFERTVNTSTSADEYKLIQEDDVTTPLYSVTLDRNDGTYKYVFLASSQGTTAVQAMDFTSVTMSSSSITIPNANASITSESILENCYIGFFDDITKNLPSYGSYYGGSEEITINKDFDIFGYGHFIQPGLTYYTPIDVVMERQFGVVEFVYNNAQVGDELICSFSSEYYRLYLSQVVKDDVTNNYTSDNSATFPENAFADYSTYTQGDYYSASGIYVNTYYPHLPVFKKTQIVTNAGTNSVQIYMPYTTAAAIGDPTVEANKVHHANYIRTTIAGQWGAVGEDGTSPQRYGSIKLEVKRGDRIVERYESEATFPIYRNGKTIFTASGDDQLKVSFSEENNADSGISLPEDKWNGEN